MIEQIFFSPQPPWIKVSEWEKNEYDCSNRVTTPWKFYLNILEDIFIQIWAKSGYQDSIENGTNSKIHHWENTTFSDTYHKQLAKHLQRNEEKKRKEKHFSIWWFWTNATTWQATNMYKQINWVCKEKITFLWSCWEPEIFFSSLKTKASLNFNLIFPYYKPGGSKKIESHSSGLSAGSNNLCVALIIIIMEEWLKVTNS